MRTTFLFFNLLSHPQFKNKTKQTRKQTNKQKPWRANIQKFLIAVHLRIQDPSLMNTVRLDFENVWKGILYSTFSLSCERKKERVCFLFIYQSKIICTAMLKNIIQENCVIHKIEVRLFLSKKSELSSATCYLFQQTKQEAAFTKLCKDWLCIIYKTHWRWSSCHCLPRKYSTLYSIKPCNMIMVQIIQDSNFDESYSTL